jgi:hypothetical protein
MPEERISGGSSIQETLTAFRDGVNQPGTIRAGDRWLLPHLDHVEQLLNEPITQEEAQARSDQKTRGREANRSCAAFHFGGSAARCRRAACGARLGSDRRQCEISGPLTGLTKSLSQRMLGMAVWVGPQGIVRGIHPGLRMRNSQKFPLWRKSRRLVSSALISLRNIIFTTIGT